MIETELEYQIETVSDWRQARRKPEYNDLNRILDESHAVNRWIRKLSGNTENKKNVLRMWFWWMKTNEPELYALKPDGLIEYQKKLRGTNNEYVIHDAIDDWLNGNGGVYNTLRTYKSTIKSFFMHNRAELAKDPTSRLKPTRYSQVAMFEIEEIRSIYSIASPMIRAVMLCMIMGGMGCDALLYWSKTGYGSLMKQLENKEPLIKVDIPGRKKNKGIKPYYTLLGKDAIKALKVYLMEREKYVKNGSSDYIFITSHGNPLTYPSFYQTWMRILRKLRARNANALCFCVDRYSDYACVCAVFFAIYSPL